MAVPNRKRTVRVEARLTKPQKALIERASRLRGVSISRFLIASAEQSAREEIAQESVIRLNPEESRRFADAILNPAPLSPEVRRRIRKYQRLYNVKVSH